MYQIKDSDGTVLYDTAYPDNYMMAEPHCTRELGQAGHLQFSILPSHPYYDRIKNMETYLTAYRDGREIFYGRVIDVNDNRVTGVKAIQCAGGLDFLNDGELGPLGRNPVSLSTEELF